MKKLVILGMFGIALGIGTLAFTGCEVTGTNCVGEGDCKFYGTAGSQNYVYKWCGDTDCAVATTDNSTCDCN